MGRWATGRRPALSPATAELPAWPSAGRRYSTERRVRLADVRPSGRTRLDAVARYLQDVASDDVREAGLLGAWLWVVRRTVIQVREWPMLDEVIGVATWCSGIGPAWAERRTSISTDRGPAIEAASVWVSLDPLTLRPVPLDERFSTTYGISAAGRTVRSRLVLGTPGKVERSRPWPLRSSDYDPLGHVNNAVAWAAVEDEVSTVCPGARIARAEVEYRSPMERAAKVTLASRRGEGGLAVWLCGRGGRGGEGGSPGSEVLVSAKVDLAHFDAVPEEVFPRPT